MRRLLPFLLIFALLLAGCAPAEPETPEENPPETVDPAPPPEEPSEAEIVLAPSPMSGRSSGPLLPATGASR